MLLKTPHCSFGWKVKNFNLTSYNGNSYSYLDIKGKNGTVVAFICNHCPYVKSIITRMVEDFRELSKYNIGTIAIMPNDPILYPEDNLEHMKVFAERNNFSFPYVIDQNQLTSKSFGAVCTPDFFGFNRKDELQYRGRLDNLRINDDRNKLIQKELLLAMQKISIELIGPSNQHSSMGCSIKWKNE